MSVSGSPLFPALSLVSVLVAGSALYFVQQQQPEPVPVQTQASFDPSRLEESISALRQEVMSLQSKLDSMDIAAAEKSDAMVETEGEENRVQLRAIEAERITAAVEAVMEERGVELANQAQRRAKIEDRRTGMSRWIGNARTKLPNLYDQIAEKMELDPETEMAVEEILETGFERMTILSEELLNGDFPEEEEAQMVAEIQGEIRQEVGTLIGELDEVLNPAQMVQLGQIYGEEVDPRIGQGIVNNGNEGDSEEETQN
ncbi:MAG: hypothetical protein DSY81_10890 [Bacillota bacterium]|nr:MAG: hypothetical protein DSY81_10890 [Bacillota bacterium]